MQEQSIFENSQQREKIGDPRRWLESQTIGDKYVSKKIFTFIDPSPTETKLEEEDIREHYKRIKSKVPEGSNDAWMMEALVDYVTAPIIQMDLGRGLDEMFLSKEVRQDRRYEWEEILNKLPPEVNLVYQRNKLKGNFIIGVLGIADSVNGENEKSATPVPAPLVAEYNRLANKYLDRRHPTLSYDNMPIDEKILFTKELTNFAKDIYKYLSEKYKPENIRFT